MKKKQYNILESILDQSHHKMSSVFVCVCVCVAHWWFNCSNLNTVHSVILALCILLWIQIYLHMQTHVFRFNLWSVLISITQVSTGLNASGATPLTA